MVFNSLQFIVFFPIVVLGYFLLPHKYRWFWLLIASIYFYMSWNPKFIILIFATIITTYLSGLGIQGADEQNKKTLKKICAAVSIIFNLTILFFFKYFDFVVESINKILSAGNFKLVNPEFDIMLPVGISFYTFQALSYTIDVYRDKDFKVEKNIGRYALFVTFFPQLVAGPIERSKNLLSQFYEKHYFEYKRVKEGLLLMLWGLFEKIVIADRAAIIVNQVFNDLESYSGFEIIVAVLLFAVQVYCDFCGYSDIAIGAAKVMGFKLMTNFRQPYFSKSIKDFWRRWHISLSTWLRDYVYIPLGGSRCSRLKKYRNLLITFLLSGLWHGANWTYVIWGGIHGCYQIIGDILLPIRGKVMNVLHIDKESFSHRLFQMIFTFGLVDMAWIFFRAPSIKEAVVVFKQMVAQFNLEIFWNGGLYKLGLGQAEFLLLLVAIGILWGVNLLRSKVSLTQELTKQHIIFRWLVYAGVVYSIIFILLLQGFGFVSQEFIYFQF